MTTRIQNNSMCFFQPSFQRVSLTDKKVYGVIFTVFTFIGIMYSPYAALAWLDFSLLTKLVVDHVCPTKIPVKKNAYLEDLIKYFRDAAEEESVDDKSIRDIIASFEKTVKKDHYTAPH